MTWLVPDYDAGMTVRKGTFAKPNKPVPARSQPTPRGVELKKAAELSADKPFRLDEAPQFDSLAYVRGLIREVPDFPQRVRDLKARGGRMVVLDPRRTETAKVATEHHFVRPGSDTEAFDAGVASLTSLSLDLWARETDEFLARLLADVV